MPKTKGAVMFDWWTNFGRHYINIYAVNNKVVKYLQYGKQCERFEDASPLISVSPVNRYETDDDGNVTTVDEGINFNAKTHVRHFEDVFHIFGVNVHQFWIGTTGRQL